MNRRKLLKLSGAAFGLSGATTTRLWAAPAQYDGEFLIQIQVGGAWDVASYCDPKHNTGDVIVNNWAETDTQKTAGNINYAPFGNNAELFEKHFDKMLVINGVNSFTNGHSAGARYNFTGTTQTGYPNLSAAFAATLQEDFPIPLMVNGGQFDSGGIIVPTRVGKDIDTFNTLLEPNSFDDKPLMPDEDLELINAFRKKRAEKALTTKQIKDNKQFITDFLVANKSFPNFTEFKRILLTVDTKDFDMNENLNQQMLYALVAFKSGVSVAADANIGRFDTHDDHDNRAATQFTTLNNSILFAWEIAEQLDITHKLNMFVASDFARTPFYNENAGKDHWPVGSTLIMKSGVSWTNRMVGKTTDELKAHKLNPANLEVDDTNGVILECNHVMDFARRMMGIDEHPLMRNFDLRTEDIHFDFSGGFYS